MFDKSVVCTDTFLDMPATTQNLYFHLSMVADDDGFVDNWRSIMKMCGNSTDDMKLLIAKSYVIPFESGVIVIKHWRLNNFLRKDRHIDTKYQEELANLEVDKNNIYVLSGQPYIGQPRIDKNRIDNNNIYINNIHQQKVDDESKISSNDIKNTSNSIKILSYEEEFERLWNKYPKKQGKKDALRHYISARKKGTTFEEVEKGIDNYNNYIKSCNISSRYIKQGSTWFNQECWNDEYSEKNLDTPNWFNKKIEDKELTKEEEQELNGILDEFRKE